MKNLQDVGDEYRKDNIKERRIFSNIKDKYRKTPAYVGVFYSSFLV